MNKEIYPGFSAYTDVMTEPLRGECKADLTLPDYQPEIRRILTVSATAVPAGFYAAGGKCEFSGSVRYNVLYVDSDGQVSLYSCTGDYLLSAPCQEGVELSPLPPVLEPTQVRLQGPRRLSLRTPLSVSVRAFVPVLSSPGATTLTADEDAVPLIRKKTLHAVRLISGRDFRVADSFPADGGELLGYEAWATVSGTKCGTDGYEIAGEVAFRLFFAEESGIPSVGEYRVPFTFDLEAQDAAAGTVSGWANLTSCSAVRDGGGNPARVDLEATLDLSVEVTTETEQSVLDDFFSAKTPTENGFEALPYTDILYTTSFTGRVEGECRREECNAGEAIALLAPSGTVRINCPDAEGDGRTLPGEMTVSAIRLTSGTPSDGEPSVSPASFRLPVSVPLPAACPTPREGVGYRVTAAPVALAFRIEGERVIWSADLFVTLDSFTRGEEKSVCRATPTGDEWEREDGFAVTALYPAPDRSLWEVAKERGIRPDVIVRENGLPEALLDRPDERGNLAGVVRLLI